MGWREALRRFIRIDNFRARKRSMSQIARRMGRRGAVRCSARPKFSDTRWECFGQARNVTDRASHGAAGGVPVLATACRLGRVPVLARACRLVCAPTRQERPTSPTHTVAVEVGILHAGACCRRVRPTVLVCSLFSPSTRFLRSIKLVVTRARRLAMLGETRAVPCVIMDALQLLQGPHGFFESLGVEHGHSTGLLESSAGVAKNPATRALRLLIPQRSPGSGDILTLLHPFILFPSVREIRKSEWIVCDASTLKLFVPPCAWLDSALCRVFCGCRAAGLCDQGLFQACSKQVGARVNFAPVADVGPYLR